MNLYLVRMEHPDGNEWNQHVLEHVRYLQGLIEQGNVLASGPLKGTPLRAGFLIMAGDSRQHIEELIAKDPFAREGLICGLNIEQWDPLFGMLEDKSSQMLPPELAPLRK